MLKEFYDFIAKKINEYFQSVSKSGLLSKGETFCLKLDDNDMVEQVYNSLRNLLIEQEITGEFCYQSPDKCWYETYTLKCERREIVIAAQTDGMSIEFLCANLRNAANEGNKPILLITSNPIDSALSGSRDMASSGMPFYADNLMSDIKKMIDKSTCLTILERSVLQFELDRKVEDVFSDKYSLFEYKDLLSIMSSGKINKENYSGFRLFSIDEKDKYLNSSEKEIKKELKKNNELYEKIDRSIRTGNLESDLAEDFDEKFIQEIVRAKNNDLENWSNKFSYHDIEKAMEKLQSLKENPLQIDKEHITAYGIIPLQGLLEDEKLFIREEGSMTGKKRVRSILIFNPDEYNEVTLKIECNVKIKQNSINADDSKLLIAGKNLEFTFSGQGLSFHKIEITDAKNAITYLFKICILAISADYMISTVKTCFSIEHKKKVVNSRIKLSGISTDLVFNKSAENNVSEKLEENKQYRCNYGERLQIYTSDEELANFGSGIKIEINFAGMVVPFSLFPDEAKSKEIIGKGILREKYSEKKSFEFIDHKHIFMNTQEYYAKENLLKELNVEEQMRDGQMLCASSDNYYDMPEPELEKIELSVSEPLNNAYLAMLNELSVKKTVPTLAYLSGSLLDAAEKFVVIFQKEYESLEEGQTLSVEQEQALRLGTITIGEQEEIFFTPFHPLNIMYHLMLLKEEGMRTATDLIMERLNSVNLLPYIQKKKEVYKASEQLYSLEWKHYAPVKNKKYMGGRKYVSKLIEEKITEFISHFRIIFDDINNKVLRINLINMGDCDEVFIGISRFYIHAINKNADVNKLMKFELHIYTDNILENAFSNIKDYSRLKKYLSKLNLTFGTGAAMNDLEGVLSKNIDCYFKKDNGMDYEYAHITFYEMESEITSETATMEQIETGMYLGGLLSGIPSSKYGQKYRTGFGIRFADENDLTNFAMLYNSLIQVGDTGNPYHSGTSISTQIDPSSETKMNNIYKASNWVVFVEPKVDLDFFSEKEANNELLIIHYSDQYTSSSGYDAITVTCKSEQYSKILQEYLNEKSVHTESEDIKKMINLFNAVNGDWLLRLISSKRIFEANKESVFTREKISIVAAIKFMLAYLKHPDIIWVPISMEEMLRVSGGVGLSQKEGILSAKNLGFESGVTCDDLLFVGLHQGKKALEIYFYPTEIKTGKNDSTVIKKALEQAKATADGLKRAFSPEDGLEKTILYKVNRNFMMQLLITSCKKMAVYHVDDSQDWDIVLEKFRNALLNENYVISNNMQELLGIGAVLSFKKDQIVRKAAIIENKINFIEMPEIDEYGLILKSVKDIEKDLSEKTDELSIIRNKDISLLFNDILGDMCLDDCFIEDFNESNTRSTEEQGEVKESNKENMEKSVIIQENQIETEEQLLGKESGNKGINILFGTNQQTGQEIFWEPNNTDKVFHTNTGIIGTMGTGKTQFTQSMIAQLYQKRGANIMSDDIGILIFDYKGDYNENKADFMRLTNAKVYKPYHLPYNPFALTWSGTPKPLLPVHTANTFVDTLAKVYPNLGPKQKNILLNCINTAYTSAGINKSISDTWSKEAPTFSTVYQVYENDEDIKKGDVLDSALYKISEFEIFEPDPLNTTGLFEMLKGVVVIDLSGYDADIQNLVVAITLDLFYSQMQAAGHSKIQGTMRQINKMILVDEADNFLREGYASLRKILKEGREFGVGTILSTQFLKHFVTRDEDYSKYILTWVVHNVADLSSSDVRFVFNTQNGSTKENQLCTDIKNLRKHESILKIGNSDNPIYIRDKAFWEYVKEHY